jgi:hypothetical protein
MEMDKDETPAIVKLDDEKLDALRTACNDSDMY